MASISSLGVGSGIDVQSLVQQLVDAEKTPTSNRLDLKQATLQAKLSAYGTFKSALSTFQSALTSLRSTSLGQTKSVAVGNADLFSASASSIADVGTYSIEVKQLAQNHSLATASGAYTSLTDTVGTGTLTFSFGTYANSDDTGAFTENANKAAKSVVIDSAHQTLSGVRDAVNAANIGVQASVVDDGNGYRLVFKSTDSGASNALQISAAEDPSGSGLADLTYDSTVKNLTRTVAAQDAIATVDGLEVSRSTNTVSGAIHGVTLQLNKAMEGSPTTLTVSQDTGTLGSTIQNFVTQFNTLQSTINTATAYDAKTGQAGPLLGDSMVRSVSSQIRQVVGGAITGLDGNYRALVDIGISTQRDGTLALDTAKLNAALADDPQAVALLFNSGGTTTDDNVNYVSATSATRPGSYLINVSQLAGHGSYTGAASSELDFTAHPTSFVLKVNGVSSSTINITAQLYSSTDEVAAELQRQINSEPTLNAAGVSVSVSYDGSGYVITSNKYGSGSSVTVTTTNATLGLSGGTAVTGSDIVGTIGGLSATGSGQRLIGTGNASGLAVDVTGTDTGNRGSVVYSRGVADQLNTLFSSILASGGVFDSRNSGIQSELTDIAGQRTQLDARMTALQDRLTKQFNAMDKIVADLRNTSDFLTNQLTSLNGLISKK